MKVVVVGFIVLALMSAGNCQVRDEPLLGEWEPIKNLKDSYVQEIAEFAVAQHNAQSNATRLKLRSVVKGETQVVVLQRTNYRLILETDPSGNYEAVVWDIEWLGIMTLAYFKLFSIS